MTRVVNVTRGVGAVVAELACDGASNADIAERLGISTQTVKTQLKYALRDTGYRTRTELVCALLRGQVRLHVVKQRGPR